MYNGGIIEYLDKNKAFNSYFLYKLKKKIIIKIYITLLYMKQPTPIAMIKMIMPSIIPVLFPDDPWDTGIVVLVELVLTF